MFDCLQGKPIVLMKDAEVQIEAYESDDKVSWS